MVAADGITASIVALTHKALLSSRHGWLLSCRFAVMAILLVQMRTFVRDQKTLCLGVGSAKPRAPSLECTDLHMYNMYCFDSWLRTHGPADSL